jgi:[protein-PII] uridylyltransferase
VLTVADIRAVGPGVWNGWKGQLMRELYSATEAVFRGGRGSDAAAALRRYQENAAYDARVRLAKVDPAAEAWGDAMEDAYFTAFTDAEVLIHARLARETAESRGAAEGRVRADLNASEVVVAAADRPRLFVDLAEAITAAGANVVGARVFTSRSGTALDVFYVQDITGQPFGCVNPAVLTRLSNSLSAAARGEPVKREARRPADLGRAAAFSITPTVMLDNDASETSTVVEASGRDRPGLLAGLARTLSDAGLQITSAHIDGYGERAVDAFYVVDAAGAKVTDARKGNALKTALLAALNDEGEAAPARRANLQKARASVAR